MFTTLTEIHEGESTDDKNSRNDKKTRLEHNKQAQEIQLQKQKKK